MGFMYLILTLIIYPPLIKDYLFFYLQEIKYDTHHSKEFCVWNNNIRVILVIITLITTPILLKELGNEGFGIITLLALLGFGGLLDLGFGQSLVRLLSSADLKNKQPHYSTAARIFLLLGLAGTLIILLISDTIISFIMGSGDGSVRVEKLLIVIIAFSLPIKMISALFSSILYAEEMMHSDNVAQTLANIFDSPYWLYWH